MSNPPKKAIFELGHDHNGKPFTIPIDFMRPEIAPPGALDGKPTVTLGVQSFREVVLMELARFLTSPQAALDVDKAEEARRVFTVLYYYTDRIDLKMTGTKKRRVTLNIDYHYYEEGKPKEEVEGMVLDAVKHPSVHVILQHFATVLPAPEKKARPKKKARKPMEGRLPVALMKANTQGRTGDISTILDDKERNNERIDLRSRARAANQTPPTEEVARFAPQWENGVKFINQGGQQIEYKPRHYQLIDGMASLLAAKSTQTKDKKAPDYYRGNAPSSEKDGVSVFATITELARFVYGMDQPGGLEVKTVKETIEELQRPEYWAAIVSVYREKKFKKDKTPDGHTEYKLTKYRPLITLADAEKAHIPEGGTQRVAGEKVLLVEIHPVFAFHIGGAKMAAVIPHNLGRLMVEAWGKSQGTRPAALWVLRDILLMAVAGGRSVHEERAHKLLEKLFPKYIKDGRRKLLMEQFTEIVNALTRLGLVVRMEEIDPDGWGPKFIFHLNRQWYKGLPVLEGVEGVNTPPGEGENDG